jgi:hypothetical protein
MSSKFNKLKTGFTEADHKKPSPIKGKAWIELSTEALVKLARKKSADAIEELKYRFNKRLEKGKKPLKAVVEALIEFGVLPDPDKIKSSIKIPGVPPGQTESRESAVGGDDTAAESGKTTPVLVVAPATDPASDEFDPSQRIVIEEPATAHQLVDAGPGTGKTAVACARVAWLAGRLAIPPSQIWLISFTRTAVQEIRNRVMRLLDVGVANAVQMATLDSMAGQLNSRLTPGIRASGSFEQNIRALHGALDKYPTVVEYLQELRHLVIDEAQDIVGARAELLLALIQRLPSSCGVTVFSDDAQAIYGFANADEEVSRGSEELPLPAMIRDADCGRKFTRRALAQVHRTADRKLRQIFTQVRMEVLEPTGDALARNRAVRQRLKELAHGEAPRRIEDAASGLTDDSFILYRRRIEAIRSSAALRRANIPHRLRISGLPLTVVPWIAAALGRADESRIGERGFSLLWQENVAGTPLATIDQDQAFTLIRDFAPDTTGRRIDIRLLRNRLSARPPLTLAHAEIGSTGPIVGTIHASKGREAGSVTLMMPGLPDDDVNHSRINEETRVLFVGATRVRGQLRVGDAGRMQGARLDSGRAYRFDKWNGNPKCDLELGRIGDLSGSGMAGRQFFADASHVIRNQQKWIELAESGAMVDAYKRKIGDDWRFCLCAAYGEDYIGVLGAEVERDLMQAAHRGIEHFHMHGQPRYPKKLDPIGVVGLTTMAIGADDPEGGLLLEPWNSTGLILAPVIYGLPRFTVKAVGAE